ncbi:MAG: hypothetical protein ACM37U_12220, partial [Gemmatimonas sp.]
MRSHTIARGALSVVVIAVAATVVWIALPLSPSLLARDGGQGVTIEDRNGIPLRSTRADDGSNARWV